MSDHDAVAPIVTFPGDVTITGLGLTLREWTDADVPRMTELFDDPDVARFTPLSSPFDVDAARVYLENARVARTEHRRLQLAVTTDGRTPLGEVLLFRARPGGVSEELATAAEAGYAIGPRHRGQGLAPRAVALMTEYAYSLGFGAVVLRIAATNTASAAVARTAGFELTAEPPLQTDAGPDPLLTWRHNPDL